MKGKETVFPLEPLRSVRSIRVNVLEGELQSCRRAHAEAEALRAEAEARLREAGAERQDYCVLAWRRLFVASTPTGLATVRYKKHLALLDQRIDVYQAELREHEIKVAEALEAVEVAASAWRKAYRKLDAVDQMKQGWARDVRHRADARDEQAVEELLVQRSTVV